MKNKEVFTQTNFRLPSPLLESARTRAFSEGISLGELLRRGMFLYLETEPIAKPQSRESRSESAKRKLKEMNEERKKRRENVKLLELLKEGE